MGPKRTFAMGHERVNRRLPQLIPKSSASDGSRGQEKRRHLLLYPRTHLEELRPGRPDRAGHPKRR